MRSTGASRNASKPPCSRSATNRRLIPSIAANSSVDREHRRRELPVDRGAVQPEVEDHERRRSRTATIAGSVSNPRSSSSRSLRRTIRAVLTRTAPRACRRRAVRARRRTPAARSCSPSTMSASASAACGSWLVSTRVTPAGAADQRLDQLACRRVEVGPRLVEQQQLGLVQHRAADRQPLHHPARQLANGLLGAALHADRRQHLLDPLGRRPRAGGRGSWRFSRPLRSRYSSGS